MTKQSLENFVANANQVEIEATATLEREAIELLKKGFCVKFVKNKCFLPLKRVEELQNKFIK